VNPCAYPPTVDAQAVACITAAFTSFISGGEDTVSAIVRTPSAATFDPATGDTTRTITEETVTGSFGVLSAELVESDSNPYELGDVAICIVKTDLSVLPIAGDSGSTFEVDSIVYRVIHVDTGQWDAHYSLIGREAR